MRTWLLFLAIATPVYARILSTKPTPSETWNPVLSLTVGGGFEYEEDGSESQYEFPLLVEYNFTEQLRATIEPKVASVGSQTGWGDLETTLGWEFLRERRYRPALTAEGIIRWPTATGSELGDPGHDYSLGLVASKDFVYVDVDVSLHYTSIGDPEEQDEFEFAVAGEVPLRHRLALLLESVTDFETGQHGRIDTEGTVGLSWRANEYLKLEAGGTLQSDGTWKVVFAWEWNFAGED